MREILGYKLYIHTHTIRHIISRHTLELLPNHTCETFKEMFDFFQHFYLLMKQTYSLSYIHIETGKLFYCVALSSWIRCETMVQTDIAMGLSSTIHSLKIFVEQNNCQNLDYMKDILFMSYVTRDYFNTANQKEKYVVIKNTYSNI